MPCPHCETMKLTLNLLGNVLKKILPAGKGLDQCLALCKNAAVDRAGDLLLRRASAAEEVVAAVYDAIPSTGPFKITPSQALKNALAKHSEMAISESPTRLSSGTETTRATRTSGSPSGYRVSTSSFLNWSIFTRIVRTSSQRSTRA